MLTAKEAAEIREKLRAALALVSQARAMYADAGCVPGIRILNGVAGLMDDEICALTKIIADLRASDNA